MKRMIASACAVAAACAVGCSAAPQDASHAPARLLPSVSKGHAMGAPMRITLDMMVDECTSVVEGRRVGVNDVPQCRVANYTGLHSDPNFEGAFDNECVMYARTFEVELVKIHLVSKHHTPEVLPRDLEKFSCATEIYEQLHFDVPRDERTEAMREAAYRKRIAEHAQLMPTLSAQLCDGTTRLYLVHAAPAGQTSDPNAPPGRRGPAFTELDEGYRLKDVKKAIAHYPKGTFTKP